MRPIDFFEEKKSYPCQKRVPPHAFNGTKRSYRQKRKYVSINSPSTVERVLRNLEAVLLIEPNRIERGDFDAGWGTEISKC